MFGSGELKFQVVAHHRLICDAGRWERRLRAEEAELIVTEAALP